MVYKDMLLTRTEVRDRHKNIIVVLCTVCQVSGSCGFV